MRKTKGFTPEGYERAKAEAAKQGVVFRVFPGDLRFEEVERLMRAEVAAENRIRSQTLMCEATWKTEGAPSEQEKHREPIEQEWIIDAPIGDAPQPKITMPPGRGMTMVVEVLFFFAREKPRVLEETIDDYQVEMIEAEAKGAPRRLLQFKYRGIFAWLLIGQIVSSTVGKILGAIFKVWKSS